MSGVDLEELKNRLNFLITPLENHYFDDAVCRDTLKRHFHVGTLAGLGLEDYRTGLVAAGAAMNYLLETRKPPCPTSPGSRPIVRENIWCLIPQQDGTWSFWKRCGKSRNGARFSGC